MVKTRKDSDAPSDLNLRTDVLLITVTPVEAQAVLSIFQKESGETFQQRVIGDKTYCDLGVFGGARVMMVQSEMGVGGPGGSLLVVDEGIRQLLPSAVIMVGIAFGLDQQNLEIGDILVSQQLFGYELQKIATDDKGGVKIYLRDDKPHASVRLIDRFRIGMLTWQGQKVEFGLILSGDKLVDNQNFRTRLLEFAPEALGGEMEGNGLYSAAYRRKVDWIIVKAVCDWADGNKRENKAAHQKLAAENAVHFTLHVLKQGGLAGEALNYSSDPQQRSSSPPIAQGTLQFKYDEHASWVLAVAWEPDGTAIVSAGGDGTVRVWEAETGKKLITYRGHTRLLNKINLQSTVYTIAWSPEGLRIASAGDGARVLVWNAATGQTLTLYQGHSGLMPQVYAVAWSPSGKQIASVCSSTGFDKTIHIWDADTGQTLTRYDAHYGLLPNFSILSLSWSTDGRYLAASCGDRTIRIWDAQTGHLISQYHFRSEWSNHIAWSPDSRYLASVHTDHTAQIWDMLREATVVTYRGHTDSVRYIAWSPDGASVATASNDRTAQIWEALTGKHLYTYQGHSHWVTSVAWSSDGTRVASASNDRTVQIWCVGTRH